MEANRKYGFSAENTLKYIQSLYEKHTTYPRRYNILIRKFISKNRRNPTQHAFYREYTESLLSQPIPMSKAVFDDTKVTDHHAIIPTEIPPSQNLSKEEKLIYDR